MNSVVAFCLLIVAVFFWLLMIVLAPWTLSDENAFLKGFVNHEFLSFMGMIVSITIASSSNLYIEINKVEERLRRELPRSKEAIRYSAYTLLTLLFISIAIVVIKPLCGSDPRTQAFFNGLAVISMICSGIILVDVVQAAFKLDPSRTRVKDEDAAPPRDGGE